MVARIGLLVALVAMTAGCGTSHGLIGPWLTPAPSSTAAIPWLALPLASPKPEPSAPPVVIPPSTPPCRSADLAAAISGRNGAGGRLTSGVAFADQASTACVLDGVPDLQLLDTTGRPIPMQSSVDDLGPGPLVPALLQAGLPIPVEGQMKYGQGFVEFSWPSRSDLPNCPNVTVQVGSVRVVLPAARGSFTLLMDPSVDAYPCAGPLGVSPFYNLAPPPPPLPAPPELAVTLAVPSAVQAGSQLRYLVTLTNPSPTPLDLAANCVNYDEELFFGSTELGSPPLGGKHFFGLNCGPAGTLAPGGHAVFEMLLPVPAGAAPGTYELIWAFGLGNATGLPATAQVRVTAR